MRMVKHYHLLLLILAVAFCQEVDDSTVKPPQENSAATGAERQRRHLRARTLEECMRTTKHVPGTYSSGDYVCECRLIKSWRDNKDIYNDNHTDNHSETRSGSYDGASQSFGISGGVNTGGRYNKDIYNSHEIRNTRNFKYERGNHFNGNHDGQAEDQLPPRNVGGESHFSRGFNRKEEESPSSKVWNSENQENRMMSQANSNNGEVIESSFSFKNTDSGQRGMGINFRSNPDNNNHNMMPNNGRHSAGNFEKSIQGRSNIESHGNDYKGKTSENNHNGYEISSEGRSYGFNGHRRQTHSLEDTNSHSGSGVSSFGIRGSEGMEIMHGTGPPSGIDSSSHISNRYDLGVHSRTQQNLDNAYSMGMSGSNNDERGFDIKTPNFNINSGGRNFRGGNIEISPTNYQGHKDSDLTGGRHGSTNKMFGSSHRESVGTGSVLGRREGGIRTDFREPINSGNGHFIVGTHGVEKIEGSMTREAGHFLDGPEEIEKRKIRGNQGVSMGEDFLHNSHGGGRIEGDIGGSMAQETYRILGGQESVRGHTEIGSALGSGVSGMGSNTGFESGGVGFSGSLRGAIGGASTSEGGRTRSATDGIESNLGFARRGIGPGYVGGEVGSQGGGGIGSIVETSGRGVGSVLGSTGGVVGSSLGSVGDGVREHLGKGIGSVLGMAGGLGGASGSPGGGVGSILGSAERETGSISGSGVAWEVGSRREGIGSTLGAAGVIGSVGGIGNFFGSEGETPLGSSHSGLGSSFTLGDGEIGSTGGGISSSFRSRSNGMGGVSGQTDREVGNPFTSGPRMGSISGSADGRVSNMFGSAGVKIDNVFGTGGSILGSADKGIGSTLKLGIGMSGEGISSNLGTGLGSSGLKNISQSRGSFIGSGNVHLGENAVDESSGKTEDPKKDAEAVNSQGASPGAEETTTQAADDDYEEEDECEGGFEFLNKIFCIFKIIYGLIFGNADPCCPLEIPSFG